MHPNDEKQLAAWISAAEETSPKITRSAVLANARTVHALDTVPYSMETLCSHGYRNDCSGKVSEWFAIPADIDGSWGGLSTVTMATSGRFRHIPASELQPGDVVGIMGPGTGGADGHVRLFEDWVTHDDDSDNRYWAIEQAGGNGPDRRMFNDLADGGHGRYVAYRYVGIIDSPTSRWSEELPNAIIRQGDYGISVTALQRALIHIGYDLGPYGPSGKGDDGIFGPRTRAAVETMQREAMAAGLHLGPTGADGIYGPYTRAAILSALAE